MNLPKAVIYDADGGLAGIRACVPADRPSGLMMQQKGRCEDQKNLRQWPGSRAESLPEAVIADTDGGLAGMGGLGPLVQDARELCSQEEGAGIGGQVHEAVVAGKVGHTKQLRGQSDHEGPEAAEGQATYQGDGAQCLQGGCSRARIHCRCQHQMPHQEQRPAKPSIHCCQRQKSTWITPLAA